MRCTGAGFPFSSDIQPLEYWETSENIQPPEYWETSENYGDKKIVYSF